MTTAQFDCQYCTASLLGKKYVLKDDNAYCVSCYDRIFSNYCEECKEPIESYCKVRLTSIHRIITYEQQTKALECLFSFNVDCSHTVVCYWNKDLQSFHQSSPRHNAQSYEM